ncbi:protein NuoC [Paenibacillus rhizovicinus]|uniref:NADH-quinone oxidoreductase subunit C n=1 Tax=Paenibacillus rhizovicinus TaxID=2704463 RepID=A0A6C0P7Q6_9BACL|nr:NADH-quinone oxidoreductase subunit C [Paenibacillus rhizovicinus]QHW32552.1 protein NuoC [Paenibacillus rhizovicinus]
MSDDKEKESGQPPAPESSEPAAGDSAANESSATVQPEGEPVPSEVTDASPKADGASTPAASSDAAPLIGEPEQGAGPAAADAAASGAAPPAAEATSPSGGASAADATAPSGEAPAVDPEREAKLKAAAEARAARAAAKAAAEGEAPAAGTAAPSGEAPAVDPEREAKLKAAAEARAARAAAKAAAEGGASAADAAAPSGEAPAVDPEKEAKVKAAAEARAARAAAKAAAEGEAAAPAEPKPPSPMQPQLDLAAELIRTAVSGDAIEEAYINELDGHRPTLIIRGEHLLATSQLLKTHAKLQMNYMRNLSGVDYETHLEVVYHLVSLQSGQEITVKVKTNREAASVPSVVPVWETANWNEREIYDLLGIDFPGHPDLRRIMMPDNWVGYPLRKDYEPLDLEV